MGSLVDSTFSAPIKTSVPLLQTYAKEISSAVETISAYCTSEGLPHPSFDPQAPAVTIPSTAPLAVQDARQKLVASAAGIQKLATEPAEYLPNLAIYVRSAHPFLVPVRERNVIIVVFEFHDLSNLRSATRLVSTC